MRSIADVIEAREALQSIPERTTKIPEGAIRLDANGVPSAALLWVLKTGLSPEEASEKYSMMWHEKSCRVFIPVGSEAVLARAVYKEDTPKYKLFGRMKTMVFIAPGKSPLVVVEDILSAIKVSKAGYKSAAILGTSVSPEVTAELAAIDETIVLWLDPDNAGLSGRKAVKKALGLYPVYVHYARPTISLDPKYLSSERIHETIEETVNNGS